MGFREIVGVDARVVGEPLELSGRIVGGRSKGGRTVRRSTLLLVAFVALAATATMAASASAAPDGNPSAAVTTIYGDGDVSCPGHYADDLSTPVGRVVFRPVEDGVHFRIILNNAAPDWTYGVAVNLELGDCIDFDAVQSFTGLTTNKNGVGRLTGTYVTEPGTYSIQVNVVSADGVPDNPLHREMAPARFVQVTVP